VLGFRDPNRDAGMGPGEGRALRFRVPDEGSTTIVDVIRGEPVFDHRTIEDFVIMRSDGSALFLLANVVDDLDMRITHVIRGEEHLPNTPKYALLWEALGGGDLPVFGHLPVIVNEKRQKLSKRRDKVALEQYAAEGYLFQAMRNYLALLGWAPSGDREIVTVEEMIAEFRLEDVNHSPAFFDEKKLRHFNAEYIRAMTPAEFVSAAGPFLEKGPWPPGAFDFDVFDAMAPLVQTRVETLSEVPGMIDFLFLAEPDIDDASWAKATKDPAQARAILDGCIAAFESIDWATDAIHAAVAEVGEAQGLKLGKAQAPVRVAVTGRSVGPPLFESLEVMGRDATLDRLRAARARLG
jgi:glutamyl-tRNA synthetase